jgi:protein MpaA
MAIESTGSGETLLATIEGLGWPALGRSRQGRPIRAAAFGPGGEPVIIVGGVHGDEPASVEAVLDLCAGGLPAGRSLWIVPALNPDGLARGTKNSAADVDLNRNFPAANFTTAHRPGYDPGPSPLSEPETAAFAELVERARPVGVVAVHAPFACINYDGPAAAWAGAVAAAAGWPARADIGYPTPGSLGTWLGVDGGLAVLTIELPPGAYQGFRAPALAGLRAAALFDPRALSHE